MRQPVRSCRGFLILRKDSMTQAHPDPPCDPSQYAKVLEILPFVNSSSRGGPWSKPGAEKIRSAAEGEQRETTTAKSGVIATGIARACSYLSPEIRGTGRRGWGLTMAL